MSVVQRYRTAVSRPCIYDECGWGGVLVGMRRVEGVKGLELIVLFAYGPPGLSASVHADRFPRLRPEEGA